MSTGSNRFETFLIALFFSTAVILILFVTGVFHVHLNSGSLVKYGYINTNGRLEIPLQFDSAGDFHHGFATVKKNGKIYVIDGHGDPVGLKPFRYQIDSVAMVHMITTGDITIISRLNHSCTRISSDSSGISLYRILRRVYSPTKSSGIRTFDFVYTFIDTSDSITKPPVFEEAFPFRNNLALVHAEYGKKWNSLSAYRNWGFIKRDRTYAFAPFIVMHIVSARGLLW